MVNLIGAAAYRTAIQNRGPVKTSTSVETTEVSKVKFSEKMSAIWDRCTQSMKDGYTYFRNALFSPKRPEVNSEGSEPQISEISKDLTEVKSADKTTGIWTRISESFRGFFQSIWTDRNKIVEPLDQAEKTKIGQLHEALDVCLTGPEKGKDSPGPRLTDDRYALRARLYLKFPEQDKNKHNQIACKQFANRVFNLYDRIEKLHEQTESGFVHRFDFVQEICEELTSLLNDPIYKNFKDEDDALINFIQLLCIKLSRAEENRSIADLTAIFPNMGKNIASVVSSGLTGAIFTNGFLPACKKFGVSNLQDIQTDKIEKFASVKRLEDFVSTYIRELNDEIWKSFDADEKGTLVVNMMNSIVALTEMGIESELKKEKTHTAAVHKLLILFDEVISTVDDTEFEDAIEPEDESQTVEPSAAEQKPTDSSTWAFSSLSRFFRSN